jgi:pimeloyl-ACP methyl ester carboxylesterase
VTTFLTHSRIRLALHELRSGPGRPLLLLHGLGERTPPTVPEELEAWPGPILGLDFTGHGASTVPSGGGYTCEILMADADTALCHLGRATVAGRGLGSYVALLLAGARPDAVVGAILRDGPGLAGGGPRPGTPHLTWAGPDEGPPDPFALAELSSDVRPPDYAAAFAFQATQLSELSRPISVSALERPDWLRAVLDEVGVEQTTIDEALAFYSSYPGA